MENGGVAQAHNAGLAKARGRLIARTDVDDEMFTGRLKAQVMMLQQQSEVGGVSCLVEFGGDRRAALGYALHVDWVNSLVEPDVIALNRFIESPLANPTMMVRREVIEKFGSYEDSPWPEDYEYWLRLLDAGVRFAKVPLKLMRWNDPPGRLSRNHPRYSENAFYECKCHYLAKWLLRDQRRGKPVYLWGAGRPTRKRFATLKNYGVELAGYIDVDPKKVGQTIDGLPVLGATRIPPPGYGVVIGAVSVRGARELIRGDLLGRGHVEGRDFVLAA
jgi:glycosyltransferase involved in cell wall biosynthesis